MKYWGMTGWQQQKFISTFHRKMLFGSSTVNGSLVALGCSSGVTGPTHEFLRYLNKDRKAA